MRTLLSICLSCALAWVGSASANPVATENVTARLLSEMRQVAPGETVQLALVFDIRPGWHTYWKNPGDSGQPPRIHWHLPEGVSAGPIRWLHPELIRVGPLANYGYADRALHLIDVTIPVEWEPGRPVDLSAETSWLVCEEHCIPESGTLALRIATGERSGPPDPAVASIFASARDGLPVPLPSDAVMRTDAAGLTLDLGGLDLPGAGEIDRVWFFAAEWGLIEHAAEQPWRMSDGRLTLDLAPGDLVGRVAADGVLVVESLGGRLAYEVRPKVIGTGAVVDEQASAPGATLGLPLALGFALLGGIILNLMPCVFPVLALKALSFTHAKGTSVRERSLQGFVYTAGVLSFFALVAAALLALRAGGADLGWGFQLQSPAFVVLMAYLFFALGLSMAGALTLGTRLMGLGAAGPKSGLAGTFFTGALAALVAAPCTAPFMGAALGYALTLSWPLALAVILTLGLGLALPYLLLTLIPGMGRMFPKPGSWMENLKQFLAFPLFGTAAWLVWVLSVQRGPDAVAAVLAGMLLLALGLWSWERTRRAPGRWPWVGAFAASLSLGLAFVVGLAPGGSWTAADDHAASAQQDPGAPAAVVFSQARLDAARAQGRPVFVNMTAAWCITCLVNERIALNSEGVARAFDAYGVLYLKGDWTSRGPVITRFLGGFGRSGVPIYVFYPPGGGDPRVLPQILTESIVLDALEVAASRRST